MISLSESELNALPVGSIVADYDPRFSYPVAAYLKLPIDRHDREWAMTEMPSPLTVAGMIGDVDIELPGVEQTARLIVVYKP